MFSIGYSILGNDLNSDGIEEIISTESQQQSILFHNITIPFDTIPDFILKPPNLIPGFDYSIFGDNIIAGDFNGDGKRDIATNLRYQELDSLNGQIYLYWGGASFDTIPDMIITRPGSYEFGFEGFGKTLENLGDVNADSFDDFIASSGLGINDTVHFLYFGGPDIDTIPDIIIADYTNVIRAAGDINNDGFNDFLTSYPFPFQGGKVNLHLGGPLVDSIPDLTIYESDIPRIQWFFGREVSGVGDVNGDGIDDFAFSAEIFDTTYRQGVVYIFAGWDSTSTDVEYNFESTLPENFALSQNYPNPFNPTTSIEFEIPHREHVTLSIYNSLGQKVRTLLDKELSVGSYSIVWDGKSMDGILVSSGIYLYRIEAGDFVETKKMMLLK